MSIETARDILFWCTVINYGMLVVWILFFTLAHDMMYRLHVQWFRISVEQFDSIHYMGMTVYKVGILLFNLVPYVVLLIIVGRSNG